MAGRKRKIAGVREVTGREGGREEYRWSEAGNMEGGKEEDRLNETGNRKGGRETAFHR